MINNSQQMRIELISKIRDMLDKNPTIKMKVIANKEIKEQSPVNKSKIFITLACLSIFSGFLLNYALFSNRIQNTPINIFTWCILPFLLAVCLYFIRNYPIGYPEDVERYQVKNIFDKNDYNMLYRPATIEDKEILDFHKYIYNYITYTEIGL